MNSYSILPNCSHGSDDTSLFDPFSHSFGVLGSVWPDGSMSSNSLVLDTEKGELVKISAGLEKKGASEAKALAALKNHSEAERRRRERINTHLSTLRGLVPCTEKMDKATLLAEVVSEVKEMKKKAAEASKGLFIPMDADDLRIEPHNNGAGNGTVSFKASMSCAYRSELLTDLKQALDALKLRMDGAEMSTLGDRVKMVLILTHLEGNNDANECQTLERSVLDSLTSVVDKGYALAEYSPRTTHPSKRRKISFFDSSSSTS